MFTIWGALLWKKKIFICTDRKFPRGDAGANRILNISKALKLKGWDVLVISLGKNDEQHFNSNSFLYEYEGVKYFNIKSSNNKYKRKFEHNLLDGSRVIGILKKQGIDVEDKVLIYSSAFFFTNKLLSFCKKRGIKVACDVVEWHQPFQFKTGRFGISYNLYKYCFENLYPSAKNIISISTYLNNYFSKKGCNTVLLPIFVEVNEDTDYYQSHSPVTNLIYPGNPYRKDSLITMLKALDSLSEEYRSRIRMHFTGSTIHHLYKCIPGEEVILDKLIKEKIVIVHSWMEYEELLYLYKRIDFALIARPINQVTKANFPSKIPELLEKGIPSITNKVGDIVNYLNDGYDSILYEGENVQECCDAIKRVLSLEKKEIERMHMNAKLSAIQKFDYKNSAMLLDDFFLNLI